MKKISYSLLILALLANISCDSNKAKIKAFAIDFAEKVSRNMIDSIRTIYPDVEKIDSLALVYNIDSIIINKTEDPSVYQVMFSKDVEVKILKEKDGKLTIKETRGLALFPEKLMKIAKSTGWVSNEMSDLQMTENLKDTAFVNFLVLKVKENLKKDIIVKGWDCTWRPGWGLGELFVIIENNSDFNITPNDYAVESWVNCRDNWGGLPPQLGSVSLVDIKPHETKKMKINMAEYPDPESKSQIDVKSTIDFTMSDKDVLNRFFHPTGNEYKEYLTTLNSTKNE